MPYPVHIVDVFAEQKYAGNQLAVVLKSDGLTQEQMQGIALEMNYSETTFVKTERDTNGGYSTKIFTPSRELSFAGHPILGTAAVLRGQEKSVTLNLAIGEVHVTFEDQIAWFASPAVTFGRSCSREAIAAAVQLAADDIDSSAPVQEITSGVSALLVPVRSLAALQKSNLSLEAFAPLAREGFFPLIYLFCKETYDRANDLCARFFFDANGVREDPATGNAAAFLGHYILEHQYFEERTISIRIEQGHQLKRPSVVRLRANNLGGVYEVHVGGRVIAVAEGTLL